MLATMLILFLVLLSIVLITKFKKMKTIIKVLTVIFIIISISICGFIISGASLIYKSLPIEMLPNDFVYNISEEKIQALNASKLNGKLNGTDYTVHTESLAYNKEYGKVTDETVPVDSYFIFCYYDFYDELNAEKGLNNIIFKEKDYTEYCSYYYEMPAVISKMVKNDDNNCIVPKCLIKGGNSSNIVSSYSIISPYNLRSFILWGGLLGEYYSSVCAFRDGQYILLVYEKCKTKGTNLFSVLNNIEYAY